MRHFERLLIITGVLIAFVAVGLLAKSYFHRDAVGAFSVSSTVFQNGGTIPDRYTCHAENVSPPLKFTNVPPQTKSLAIIMHDLDAPGGDYTHWLVWGIPPQTKSLNEGAVPPEATQGTADFGIAGYGGPCPPSGTHRYVLDVYALNATLDLPKTTRRAALDTSVREHVIAQSSLQATVTAKKQ